MKNKIEQINKDIERSRALSSLGVVYMMSAIFIITIKSDVVQFLGAILWTAGAVLVGINGLHSLDLIEKKLDLIKNDNPDCDEEP